MIYIYVFKGEIETKIVAATGLTPNSVLYNPSVKIEIEFTEALSEADKSLMDDFMGSRGYVYEGIEP